MCCCVWGVGILCLCSSLVLSITMQSAAVHGSGDCWWRGGLGIGFTSKVAFIISVCWSNGSLWWRSVTTPGVEAIVLQKPTIVHIVRCSGEVGWWSKVAKNLLQLFLQCSYVEVVYAARWEEDDSSMSQLLLLQCACYSTRHRHRHGDGLAYLLPRASDSTTDK